MSFTRRAVCITDERRIGEVTVLSLRYDYLESGDCPLKRRVDELVAEGRQHILLDLGLLANLDSSDIGRLIRAHLTVRRQGARVHLCRVLPGVRSLLAMTRLDTVFDVYDTAEKGAAALNRSR